MLFEKRKLKNEKRKMKNPNQNRCTGFLFVYVKILLNINL